MFGRRAVASSLVFGSVLLMAGCGDGGAPSGGQYGGNGAYVDPTGGGSSGDGGMMPASDGATPPPPPPGDSGGPPPPPSDSGSPPPPPGDSGGPPPPVDAGTDTAPPPPPPAPTWTQIYDNYLKGGTVGNCGLCHGLSSPSAAYSYLQGRGQISGTSSALVNPSYSDLSWFGGNMPPGGPSSDAKAQSDMQAWAAAGALNN